MNNFRAGFGGDHCASFPEQPVWLSKVKLFLCCVSSLVVVFYFLLWVNEKRAILEASLFWLWEHWGRVREKVFPCTVVRLFLQAGKKNVSGKNQIGQVVQELFSHSDNAEISWWIILTSWKVRIFFCSVCILMVKQSLILFCIVWMSSLENSKQLQK